MPSPGGTQNTYGHHLVARKTNMEASGGTQNKYAGTRQHAKQIWKHPAERKTNMQFSGSTNKQIYRHPAPRKSFRKERGWYEVRLFSHHGNGEKILMNRGSCDKAHRARKTNMAVLAFLIGILIFWGLADCCVEQVKVPAYIVM